MLTGKLVPNKYLGLQSPEQAVHNFGNPLTDPASFDLSFPVISSC